MFVPLAASQFFLRIQEINISALSMVKHTTAAAVEASCQHSTAWSVHAFFSRSVAIDAAIVTTLVQ
jgi:hypothetical protein